MSEKGGLEVELIEEARSIVGRKVAKLSFFTDLGRIVSESIAPLNSTSESSEN